MSMDMTEQLRALEQQYPVSIHTYAGRLFTSVRRMQAERDLGIPTASRTGVPISTKFGRPANELNNQEWEEFYGLLSAELRKRYPELYQRLFP